MHKISWWRTLHTIFFAEQRCPACLCPFIPLYTEHDATKKTVTQLCPQCATHITVPPFPRCHLCGDSLPQSTNKTTLCTHCFLNPPPWDGLCYYAHYEGLLRELILRYKFEKNMSLLPLLAQFLYEACATIPLCHVLIPMPRHTKRLASQGFNQILELCRPLATRLHIPLQYTCLQRTRATPPQASLSVAQRRHNPANSFMAQNVVQKYVLLIDDIMTTGSTLRHATKALRKAGAKKVYIGLIAHATR